MDLIASNYFKSIVDQFPGDYKGLTMEDLQKAMTRITIVQARSGGLNHLKIRCLLLMLGIPYTDEGLRNANIDKFIFVGKSFLGVVRDGYLYCWTGLKYKMQGEIFDVINPEKFELAKSVDLEFIKEQINDVEKYQLQKDYLDNLNITHIGFDPRLKTTFV